MCFVLDDAGIVPEFWVYYAVCIFLTKIPRYIAPRQEINSSKYSKKCRAMETIGRLSPGKEVKE